MSVTRRELLVGVGALAACSNESPEALAVDVGAPASEDEVLDPNANWPLHLTASGAFQANSQGGVNAKSLQNPSGRPMEVREIKFQLRTDSQSITGQILGVSLELAGIPLTKGFVPVWLFNKTTNYIGEQPQAASTCYAEYCWKLTRPLYVPPGATIVPQVQHFGLLPNDVALQISYSAREVPTRYKRPSTIAVPYVCSWLSKGFDPYGAADSDQSTEEDLANVHNSIVRVHRMVGKASYALLDPTPANNFLLPDWFDGSSRYMRLRAVTSAGEPIIKDLSQFNSIFSPITSAWEMDWEMPPNSHVTAYLDKLATTNTTANVGKIAQYGLALVGSREVKTP